MNKIIKTVLWNSLRLSSRIVIIVLFPLCFSIALNAQTISSGIREIELPYNYFLRESDFLYLYQIKTDEQIKSERLKINEDFLQLIEKRQYKQAQASLIQNYNHPFYLLNLMLLYIYLDHSDYKPLFITWQESSDQEIIKNFIDILETRKLNKALEKFSSDLIYPELKRYAYYKIYKTKEQPSRVFKNFLQWKNELPDKNQYSLLYEKAYADWLFTSKKNYDQTRRSKISSPLTETITGFEDDLIHKKYTRDMLSKYISYMVEQKKWNEIKKLLDKINWLNEEEKMNILQKTNELEKNDQPAMPEDYINVKIIK
ncbi:MAG: hypothetical protein OEV78_02370 [Spirochaetia bacterium]|nr:hypothetical protein [Spirochaetia bacterium]